MIDLQAVKRAHRKFLLLHEAAVTSELERAGKVGVAYVQTKPGFTPRTGALQKATTAKVIRTARGGIVRLQNPEAHASSIDKGARPHIIRARSGGVLRFVGRGGALVFTRIVHHPGNKAYHFLSNASEAAGAAFFVGMTARQAQIARTF